MPSISVKTPNMAEIDIGHDSQNGVKNDTISSTTANSNANVVSYNYEPPPGHLGNLSQEQQDTLSIFKGKITELFSASEDGGLGLPSSAQTLWQCNLLEDSDARDIIFLKFLRAENFEIDNAVLRFEKTLKWRLENDIDDLLTAKLPDVFQGHDFQHGHCKNGRPILVSHFGGMDIEGVFGDTDLFVKYRVHVMEKAVQALLPFQKGKPETLFQVHDYKDCPVVFKSKSVDNGVKAISAILGDHYPEFKGKTCFVHFPGVVAAAWKAACLLVVPETTAKKMAFYSDPAEGLLGDVDAGVLSELIGGLCEEANPPPPASILGQGVVPLNKANPVFSIPLPSSERWEEFSKLKLLLRELGSKAELDVVSIKAGDAELLADVGGAAMKMTLEKLKSLEIGKADLLGNYQLDLSFRDTSLFGFTVKQCVWALVKI